MTANDPPPPPLPAPDHHSTFGGPRTYDQMQEEAKRQRALDHLADEQAAAERRGRQRAANGIGLGDLVAFGAATLGLGSLVILHDVVATVGEELLVALAALVPESWPSAGLAGLGVRIVLAVLALVPWWLAAWVVKEVRTAGAVQLSGGFLSRIVRWGWLTTATLVRALLTLTGLVAAWSMFEVLRTRSVAPVIEEMRTEGVVAAALLILPACMVRSFFLPRNLGL